MKSNGAVESIVAFLRKSDIKNRRHSLSRHTKGNPSFFSKSFLFSDLHLEYFSLSVSLLPTNSIILKTISLELKLRYAFVGQMLKNEVNFQCSRADAAMGAGMNTVPTVGNRGETQVWRA